MCLEKPVTVAQPLVYYAKETIISSLGECELDLEDTCDVSTWKY